MLLLSLVLGCTFDEELPQADITGTVVIPREAATRPERIPSGSSPGPTSEEVFEEVGAILAELRFDARYAELQSAYASVFQAVGLNNYPAELTGHESLETLEAALHDMWLKRGEGLH